MLVAVINLWESQFSTRVLQQNEQWKNNTATYTTVKEQNKERGSPNLQDETVSIDLMF